ncbi:riboflavin synthase [Sphingomicrobium astaxanthinifaciens]|uniref:riboflavin synthase n=1 Tax=Sphingomicrobium astaxanthinifaciens TaxID=1227949 RepID=UPI001FCBAD73|nr:riboflavin synthase [Sphingomicrobium astaxanthinifaciens]MCJ7421140.1 riboflavin synthase [Sphingomicrobium astaxanthinifaciens]
MFTGIITDIGTVRSVEERGDKRLVIGCDYDMDSVDLGASIACSGACLTVVDKGEDWFAVDVSGETVSKTAPGLWVKGARLNLERALRMGDELGGHIVTGHVDGLAELVASEEEGGSLRLKLEAPRRLGAALAAKGSVTLDGVSLTVNDVEDAGAATRFTVNLIPHTAQHTTFDTVAVGRRLNLEIDVLARYLERMLAAREPTAQ